MAPERIPLFPLHVVLFPGALLPLHVFELRYRAMMADVLGPEGDPHPEPGFGIARIREGFEVGARADTASVGTVGRIEAIQRYDDGTVDLVVRGTRRFRVVRRPPDDPYPQADVEFLDEPPGSANDRALTLARGALARYLGVVARLAGRDTPALELPDDPVAAGYAAAGMLAVEPSRLQALLEAPTAADRLARVTSIARTEAALLDTIGPPVRATQLRGRTLN